MTGALKKSAPVIPARTHAGATSHGNNGSGFFSAGGEALAPQNDAQRWLKSTALEISRNIAEARWLVVEQSGSSIQWPFLAVLVFWLAAIFASFGLFAPYNGSVITVLFISALSVAGSIYLIVEMDQPYGGLIRISSAPLHAALDQLGRQ
jgi:hypothetical protein